MCGKQVNYFVQTISLEIKCDRNIKRQLKKLLRFEFETENICEQVHVRNKPFCVMCTNINIKFNI